MSYLDCSEHDCCHNKGGQCCLNGINVHHTGEHGAACKSYCNNEAYGNVAIDNPPASAETGIGCDDSACRFNESLHCAAQHVTIKEGVSGPVCGTRIES